jgi:PAS domain-containing protein
LRAFSQQNFSSLGIENQIEEALRQSEERFSKAFLASPAGIVMTRLEDGRIIDTNESYLSMIGYHREEVIGRTTVELGVRDIVNSRRQLSRQLPRLDVLKPFNLHAAIPNREPRTVNRELRRRNS